MATPDRVSYWNKTKSLMFVMLALWVFFGYVIHLFVGHAQQHRHSRLPARLLHGRAGFAHRLRRHAVLVCTQAERHRRRAWRGRRLIGGDLINGYHHSGGAGSDFTSNLGRIYTIYTGGFIAFIILMAILSALGVPNRVIGYMFMGFTIVIYAVIGIMSRTMHVGEYYVAGRRVPGALQRHGDRRRLDVGRILHRHGRLALPARL